MNAVIVEDKRTNSEFLAGLLQEYCPDIVVKGEARCVDEGVELIEKTNPALLFLDIEMPDGTGFDLLQRVPNRKFQTIFTTGHDNYILKALKFSALDYLFKPVNYQELKVAVQKARHRESDSEAINNISLLLKNLSVMNEGRNRKIAFPTLEGHTFIDVQEIIRMEADGNYTVVHLKNHTKIMASKTLKEFEVFVDKYDFMRIHRAHIINMHHIKNYVRGKGGYVVMEDGSDIEVSVRKKEEFLERISKW